MMKMRNSLLNILRRSLVLAVLLFSLSALALAERRERAADAWRPIHFDVSLELNDQLTEIIRAETKIYIEVMKTPLTMIDLDFGQMTIDSVKLIDVPVRFEQVNGKLNIQLPHTVNKDATLNIVVNYHGRPADGLILMKDKAGNPSATGDNWPDRVHHWIPCLDHPSVKATVNFNVTVPARDIVVANGQWMATRTNPDTTRTWTYREARPIPPYCMVIAVGEYAESRPQPNTIPPLSYYVPQTDRDAAVRGFSAAPHAMKFFSERVAPFPYEKLALIVGATRFGGMENSSAIVFSSSLFNTPVDSPPLSPRFNIRRGLMEVTAHELAHQWFGDAVSIKTWSDLWLSEGFADYFAGLFIEQYEGKDAFREYMRLAAEKYLNYERGRRAPIYDTETEELMKLLNPTNYEKGAWVLHMLRGILGDAQFFKGIRDFYLRHEHKAASTEDLRAAMEKASGMSLKEFFARWVYQSGHPSYEASWSWRKSRGERGTLKLHLRQTQDDAPFLTPLPVNIVTGTGTRRVLFKPNDRETTLFIPLQRKPSDVQFDPEQTILKELVVRQQANAQSAKLLQHLPGFRVSIGQRL